MFEVRCNNMDVQHQQQEEKKEQHRPASIICLDYFIFTI